MDTFDCSFWDDYSKLNGFVCYFTPAAPGSNPGCSINLFRKLIDAIICHQFVNTMEIENNYKKEAIVGQINFLIQSKSN